MKTLHKTLIIIGCTAIFSSIVFSCRKEKSAILTGTIYQNILNNGISGVQITVTNGSNISEGISTKNGMYKVKDIKPGDNYKIFIQHPHYELTAPLNLHRFDDEEVKQKNVEVKLKPTEKRRLSMKTLLTNTNNTIGGVRLNLRGPLAITQNSYAKGQSDEDGYCDFDSVPIGKYELVAEHRNYNTKIISLSIVAEKNNHIETIYLTPKTISISTNLKALKFGSTLSSIPLTLSNSGTGNGEINWTIKNLPRWLNVSQENGSFTTEQEISFTVDRNLLTTNKDSAYINIEANEAGNKSILVSVSKISQNPVLNLNTNNLNFGDKIVQLPLIIKNAGDKTLNWSIETTNLESWLEINNTSGKLESTKSDTIFLGVNRTDLKKDIYKSFFTLKSKVGDETVTISMEVKTVSNDYQTLKHISKINDLKAYRYNGEIGGHKIWGFVTGHNIFRDYEWAEKYEIEGKASIYEIISHHGGIVNEKDKKASFKIYSVGNNGLPKDLLGSKEIKYGDINLNGNPTRTKLENPIPVEKAFFVSFFVEDYAHNPQANDKDTIIVLTSEDGSRKDDNIYGRNVVRQHSGVDESGIWTDMATDLDYSDLQVYLAIFPVIKFH